MRPRPTVPLHGLPTCPYAPQARMRRTQRMGRAHTLAMARMSLSCRPGAGASPTRWRHGWMAILARRCLSFYRRSYSGCCRLAALAGRRLRMCTAFGMSSPSTARTRVQTHRLHRSMVVVKRAGGFSRATSSSMAPMSQLTMARTSQTPPSIRAPNTYGVCTLNRLVSSSVALCPLSLRLVDGCEGCSRC